MSQTSLELWLDLTKIYLKIKLDPNQKKDWDLSAEFSPDTMLKYCKIYGERDPGDFELLLQILRINPYIEELCITNCLLNDAQTNELLSAIINHPAIKHLNIEGQYSFNDEVVLGRLVRKPILRSLTLKMPLDSTVTKVIANNLRGSMLTDLTLAGCNLGDDGVEILAEGIRQESALCKIDVSGNAAAYNSLVKLADVCKDLWTLTDLNINHNLGLAEARRFSIFLVENNIWMPIKFFPTYDSEINFQIRKMNFNHWVARKQNYHIILTILLIHHDSNEMLSVLPRELLYLIFSFLVKVPENIHAICYSVDPNVTQLFRSHYLSHMETVKCELQMQPTALDAGQEITSAEEVENQLGCTAFL